MDGVGLDGARRQPKNSTAWGISAAITAAALTTVWAFAVVWLLTQPGDSLWLIRTNATNGVAPRSLLAVIMVVVVILASGAAAVLSRVGFNRVRDFLFLGTLLAVDFGLARVLFAAWPSADYGLGAFQSTAVSVEWFVAALGAGALSAVIIAMLTVRRRPPSATAFVALIGALWVVVGSGLFRPRLETYQSRTGAVVSAIQPSNALIGCGVAIVFVGLAVILRAQPHSRVQALSAATTVVLGGGACVLASIAASQPVTVVGKWVEGRPLRRRGQRVVPAYHAAAETADASERVGRAWVRAAAHEKSSIAAFQVLSDRLVEMGAPRDLVRRCDAAALDEERHTTICLALAAAAGTIGTVDEMRISRSLTTHSRRPRRHRQRIRRLVRESIIDGMLGEGFAAARLEIGATQAQSETVRAKLTSIAADERAHASLAADIVVWCQHIEPEATNEEFQRALRRVPAVVSEPAIFERTDAATRRHSGFVDHEQAAECWQHTRQHVLHELASFVGIVSHDSCVDPI